MTGSRATPNPVEPARRTRPGGPGRALAVLVTVVSAALVWAALTLPDRLSQVEPAAFVTLPFEAVLLAAVAVLVPPRPRKVCALTAGIVLGVGLVLHLLDLAVRASLDRPFDVLHDWTYLGSLADLIRTSTGPTTGDVLLTAAAVLLVGSVVAVPLALLRLTRLLAGRRRRATPVLVVLSLAWSLLALLDTRVGGHPAASAGATAYTRDVVARVQAERRDQVAFASALTHDPLARTLSTTPPAGLLRGLRGKDVLVVFVESYGRAAVNGSWFSTGVRRVLEDGTRRLTADGFGARSAFLTSPTFGGISWLAHSTFESGTWVSSQQRYDQLLASRRSTLSRAFARAGWRTVSDVPANTRAWPQGSFYGFDQFYDARNVGYAGPRFGYPTMPDQYTLEALHRLELAPAHRRPVMAEVDLVSSHTPWARTPRMIDPGLVGDGSAYDAMPASLPSQREVWDSRAHVQAAYARAVEYSLRAVLSFVEQHSTDRTVLVVLGDHQPATIVTGQDASHDVPVTVIARDERVLHQVDGWHWQTGLLPGTRGPVWRMDTFRDRFLRAFSR